MNARFDGYPLHSDEQFSMRGKTSHISLTCPKWAIDINADIKLLVAARSVILWENTHVSVIWDLPCWIMQFQYTHLGEDGSICLARTINPWAGQCYRGNPQMSLDEKHLFLLCTDARLFVWPASTMRFCLDVPPSLALEFNTCGSICMFAVQTHTHMHAPGLTQDRFPEEAQHTRWIYLIIPPLGWMFISTWLLCNLWQKEHTSTFPLHLRLQQMCSLSSWFVCACLSFCVSSSPPLSSSLSAISSYLGFGSSIFHLPSPSSHPYHPNGPLVRVMCYFIPIVHRQ